MQTISLKAIYEALVAEGYEVDGKKDFTAVHNKSRALYGRALSGDDAKVVVNKLQKTKTYKVVNDLD